MLRPPRGYSAGDSPAEAVKKAPIQTLKEHWTTGKPWARTVTKCVAKWVLGWLAHVWILTTVTFAEQGGKTKQILRARVIELTAQAAPYLAGMEAGWTQSLERLVSYVAKH